MLNPPLGQSRGNQDTGIRALRALRALRERKALRTLKLFILRDEVVALTGIEPVLFALRGRRVNQLHHSARGERSTKRA